MANNIAVTVPTVEQAPVNPLQSLLETLLTLYPNTGEYWVEPFSQAKVVKVEEVSKKDKTGKYVRATLEDQEGTTFYCGGSTIAKLAKANGNPADKLAFFRTFEKPGDLKTAEYKAELV